MSLKGNHVFGPVIRKLGKVIKAMEGAPVVTEREFGNLAKMLCNQLSDDYDQELFQVTSMMDVYYRKLLLSEYYGISLSVIDEWINMLPGQRKKWCAQAGVNGYIFRTLFDYNSYRDCFFVYSILASDVDFRGTNVLDFGCMVSDYGYFFGMLGARVTLCDFLEHADFAEFRLRRAGIECSKVYAPAHYDVLTSGQDMVFFGEVLEHLTDPLSLLQSCVNNGVQCIYTSFYPYGDDVYFNLTGHTLEAKEQAPESLRLLRTHYQEICFENFRRLWVAK